MTKPFKQTFGMSEKEYDKKFGKKYKTRTSRKSRNKTILRWTAFVLFIVICNLSILGLSLAALDMYIRTEDSQTNETSGSSKSSTTPPQLNNSSTQDTSTQPSNSPSPPPKTTNTTPAPTTNTTPPPTNTCDIQAKNEAYAVHDASRAAAYNTFYQKQAEINAGLRDGSITYSQWQSQINTAESHLQDSLAYARSVWLNTLSSINCYNF